MIYVKDAKSDYKWNEVSAGGNIYEPGTSLQVYTIDASSIAEAELGNRSLSNTSMLGAIVKVSGVLPEAKFMEDVLTSLKQKFASKPHVIEKNMKALERGMKEVQA